MCQAACWTLQLLLAWLLVLWVLSPLHDVSPFDQALSICSDRYDQFYIEMRFFRIAKIMLSSKGCLPHFVFTLQEFVDDLVKDEELPEAGREKFMVSTSNSIPLQSVSLYSNSSSSYCSLIFLYCGSTNQMKRLWLAAAIARVLSRGLHVILLMTAVLLSRYTSRKQSRMRKRKFVRYSQACYQSLQPFPMLPSFYSDGLRMCLVIMSQVTSWSAWKCLAPFEAPYLSVLESWYQLFRQYNSLAWLLER